VSLLFSPKPTRRAMISRLFGRLLMVWHHDVQPTTEEWQEFLDLLRLTDPRAVRGLVLTEGGAPTPSQQLALAKQVGASMIPVAVVSNHIGVRFVASSLALVTKRIRSFAKDEMAAVYGHLELGPEEIHQVQLFVAQTQALARR
jgi:hypothetical protein